jgi:hypothetical protein
MAVPGSATVPREQPKGTAMAVPPDPDPTMQVPTGGEPTMPVPPDTGDATIPVQGETFGGGTGGPGGPGGPTDQDYEEGDNRRLWLIAGGILALGLIVGIIIAVAASGGGDDTATTTTSSSSTTTSSTTTTTLPVTTTTPPTTLVPAPTINQFTANQNPVSCPSTTKVSLTWATTNAQGVTVSIDDPNGPFGNYGADGTQSFPFACGNGPGSVQHTYFLRANGAGGQNTQKQIVVTGNSPPPASTTSSTGP